MKLLEELPKATMNVSVSVSVLLIYVTCNDISVIYVMA